jgi:hypothetical protein
MQRRWYHVSISSTDGFAVSFEQAAAALERLERMFTEPDGSFVWNGVSPAAGGASAGAGPMATAWQLEGVLYDHGGRLVYIELKGDAPPEALDRLLAAFGWPQTTLAFHMMREGIALDEAAFRAWLAGGSAPGLA